MARITKPTSPYSNTLNKDFYLDIWEVRNIKPSINDQQIEISSKYHLRPDKMSYDLYGTPKLWWVFSMVNKDVLIDPINDFTSGTIITIPNRARIENEVL